LSTPLALKSSKRSPPTFRIEKEHSRSPYVALPFTFPYQSWFDNTLQQNAIAVQPTNAPIISPSGAAPNGILVTLPIEQQSPGWSLTLSSASETPIAVSVRGESNNNASPAVVIVPGQTITPLGGVKFRSFRWGLPFGWLGGGMARLLVGQAEYQPEGYTARPEIAYHRARFPIYQPSGVTSTALNNAPYNWPGRFPWINAQAGTNQTNQGGNPSIKPEPSRALLVLRGVSTLAGATSMIAVIQGSNEFQLDAGGTAGSVTLTNPVQVPLSWPAFNSFGTSGNLATQNVCIELDATSPLVRLAADSAGIVFVDASGSSALANCYVDIVRFGRL
jgi:hypothetical protein